MTNTELEELEAVRKIATAQPWFYEPHGDTGYYGIGFGFEQGDTSLSNPINGEVDMLSERPFVAEAVAADVNGQANARLIVSAVNALPALIARIRKLEAENAETKQGYEADVRALCETLWKRDPGCEFVRLNYPQIAAALDEVKP